GQMKMAATGLETASEVKAAQPPAVDGKLKVLRRRRSRKENVETSVAERFFLAESNGNGNKPALARGVVTARQAIIEAFKAGVNFFKISEFRSRAEVSSSGDPILKREAVKNTAS